MVRRKGKTMSVQNIGNNKWRVVVKQGIDRKSGKIKYTNKTVNGSHQDAKNVEAKMQIKAGEQPDSDITFGFYLRDIWLESLEVEENTYAYYEGAVRLRIEPGLGSLSLCSLTEFNLSAFLRSIAPGYTRVQAKKTLSKALNDARRWKLVKVSPMENVEVKSGKPKKKGGKRGYETFSAEECQRILHAAIGSPIEYGIIAMMCGSARREEACALDFEDFDPTTGRSPVTKACVVSSRTGKAYMKDPKNDESWRDLIFKGYARTRLGELSRGKEGPAMMYREKRMRPDYFYDLFKRLLEEAGVKYLPVGHLRHTFATQSLLSGTNPATLKELMGHSRVIGRNVCLIFVHIP